MQEFERSCPAVTAAAVPAGQNALWADDTRFVRRRDHARAKLTAKFAPGVGGGGRGVLEGAFALLRALPFSPAEGQVAALAATTGIPRSSVYRLLDQLVDEGVVVLAYGRYLLTSEMLVMAELNEPEVDFRPVAQRHLQALRERTGATVTCVVAEGTSAYVLSVIPGVEKLPVDLYPGRVLPAGAAASVLLAPTTTAGAARRRFVTDRESVLLGLTCYATDILLRDRRTVALQLSTPPSAPAEHFAPLVNRVAMMIGRAMSATNGARG